MLAQIGVPLRFEFVSRKVKQIGRKRLPRVVLFEGIEQRGYFAVATGDNDKFDQWIGCDMGCLAGF